MKREKLKKNIEKEKKGVLVMGGGLAGLSAGYELAKRGFKVVVLEKCSQVGGLAQTIEVDGFRFDTGPHRWYTKSNLVEKWVQDLMQKEMVRVPRLTRIYFDKKFFYYPIRLRNALGGIGIRKAFQAVIDYFWARIKFRFSPSKLLTMEDGYIHQFGRTLYEIFFKRYSEKLWGRDCSQISVDWVGQRTRGLNITSLLRETFLRSKKIVSLVDEFSYPERGIGRLAEKMAQQILRRKGKIYTNCEVVRINEENNRIISVVGKMGKRLKIFKADYFISSLPLDELVFRIKPDLEKKIISLAKKLNYRDEVQVALFVHKSHITPDTWIYVHPKEIPFMRIMEMDNWSEKLSPQGATTLVFEIACNEGDAIWEKQDRQLINLVAKTYIQEFGFISKRELIGGYVHRVRKEYPVYHLGYREDLAQIKQALNQFSNLQLVGRNGTFRYNNMDHSIEMGLYAAWNILEGRKKYDIESVNIEREYLEERKIENLEDERLEKN